MKLNLLKSNWKIRFLSCWIKRKSLCKNKLRLFLNNFTKTWNKNKNKLSSVWRLKRYKWGKEFNKL